MIQMILNTAFDNKFDTHEELCDSIEHKGGECIFDTTFAKCLWRKTHHKVSFLFECIRMGAQMNG